jgi:hypothetical protein
MLLALLLFPGAVFAILLGMVYGTIVERHQPATCITSLLNVKAWQSGEGMLSMLSILAIAPTLVFLPMPFHPAASSITPAVWLLAWGSVELAYLLAVLPGLLAGEPHVVRAAIREVQIGVAGRALLWLAVSTGLLLSNDWSLVGAQGHSPLLVHVLALAAAAFAFPIAAGWGPFGGETGITHGGLQQGLDRPTSQLMMTARMVRTAVLLALVLVAVFPFSLVIQIGEAVGLALLLGVFVLAAFAMRHFRGTFPRLSLPLILRTCWWRALPTSIATIIYLIIVTRG